MKPKVAIMKEGTMGALAALGATKHNATVQNITQEVKILTSTTETVQYDD